MPEIPQSSPIQQVITHFHECQILPQLTRGECALAVFETLRILMNTELVDLGDAVVEIKLKSGYLPIMPYRTLTNG